LLSAELSIPPPPLPEYCPPRLFGCQNILSIRPSFIRQPPSCSPETTAISPITLCLFLRRPCATAALIPPPHPPPLFLFHPHHRVQKTWTSGRGLVLASPSRVVSSPPFPPATWILGTSVSCPPSSAIFFCSLEQKSPFLNWLMFFVFLPHLRPSHFV